MSFDESTVQQILLEIIAEILPHISPDDVTGEMNLSDLGADSIDRVEILAALHERTGDSRPLSSLADIADINELVAYLGRVDTR